jgi:hypothetical protein
MNNTFFRFKFTSDALVIGERIKKGTFRPCLPDVKTKNGKIVPIPFSTITGALENYLGENNEIYAIGKIIKFKRENMTFAPFDKAIDSSKLPLVVEYLTNVEGEFYLKKTKVVNSEKVVVSALPNEKILLGGLKSKGFGECDIISVEEIEPKEIKMGRFLSRIYYEEELLKIFGIDIKRIEKHYWGYLFRKTSITSGYYQRSIFENSIVRGGYDFIMGEIDDE